MAAGRAPRRRRRDWTSASPSCRSSRDTSIEENRARAGVPVFRRPTVKPSSRRRVPSPSAGGSPSLPPGPENSPMNRRASMKVPVVSTTARARKRRPRSVTTPRMAPSSSRKSVTVSWNRARLGVRLQGVLGLGGVPGLVGLGPGGLDRGALGAVQDAELDHGCGRSGGPSGRPGRRSRAPGCPWPGRRWPGCRTGGRWRPGSGSPAGWPSPGGPGRGPPRSRRALPR